MNSYISSDNVLYILIVMDYVVMMTSSLMIDCLIDNKKIVIKDKSNINKRNSYIKYLEQLDCDKRNISFYKNNKG